LSLRGQGKTLPRYDVSRCPNLYSRFYYINIHILYHYPTYVLLHYFVLASNIKFDSARACFVYFGHYSALQY